MFTLYNLISVAGQYKFLEKMVTYFTHFHLLTPPPPNSNICICSTYLFHHKPPAFSSILLLTNQIFSWKNKLKLVQILRAFLQDAYSPLTKQKKCLLKASYGTSETSKQELFTKKSERLVAENNFCEKLHLRCFKSIGLTQNTSSLFGKSFRHRTIKLRRIKILKTSCRKLSILSKFWLNDAHGQGWEAGGELVCVIMTHCVRKPICDY